LSPQQQFLAAAVAVLYAIQVSQTGSDRNQGIRLFDLGSSFERKGLVFLILPHFSWTFVIPVV